MSKTLMTEFEAFVKAKDKKEELEMMEDFVLHNLDVLSPKEIAQAIREGVTKLSTIESILGKL